jgi:hypothetical protein
VTGAGGGGNKIRFGYRYAANSARSCPAPARLHTTVQATSETPITETGQEASRMPDLRTWPGPQRPAWDNGMAAADRPVPDTHIALAASEPDEEQLGGSE